MDTMELDNHLQNQMCSKLGWEIANLDNKFPKSFETWCESADFLISAETSAWKEKRK